MEILFIACFFSCALLGILLLGTWLTRKNAATIPSEIAIIEPPVRPTASDFFENTVTKVGQVVRSGAKTTRTEKLLQYAGYRKANALAIFNGLKATSACALGLLAGIITAVSGAEPMSVLTGVFAAIGIGYLLPERIIEVQVKRRSNRLRTGLPVAVDLLVLGLEAGQSLDSAITEAGREVRAPFPDIAKELAWVQMEMSASKSRSEAFRSLSDRNIEPEMKRFAQVLIDCDRFGTGLAVALRSQVKYLRIRMRQQSREAARKVGVKLVFPVFFLIFPSVLLVTLGPAVLQISSQLTPLMMGK